MKVEDKKERVIVMKGESKSWITYAETDLSQCKGFIGVTVHLFLLNIVRKTDITGMSFECF